MKPDIHPEYHPVVFVDGEHEIITCYIAYACMWQHPSGRAFECDIAENVIRSIPEYKPRASPGPGGLRPGLRPRAEGGEGGKASGATGAPDVTCCWSLEICCARL